MIRAYLVCRGGLREGGKGVLHNASEMAGNSSHLCVLPRPGRGPDGEKGHDVEGCKRQLLSAARPFEIAAETRHRGKHKGYLPLWRW